MAIQLGTASQLQIIIPSEGDLNWADDFKTQFAQRIVEHNHTGSGTGAKISNEALINTTDVSQGLSQTEAVGTNVLQDLCVTTSKLNSGSVTIDKLDSNVSQKVNQVDGLVTDVNGLITDVNGLVTDVNGLITDVTNNTSDINTNTSDISALTSRVNSLESLTDYDLSSSSADLTLPVYLSNANVLLDGGSCTINNKVFENVRFSLDCSATFQSCTFRNCFIGEGDNTATGWSLTMKDSNVYSTEIMGMSSIYLYRTNFYRGSIKSVNLYIDNTTATGVVKFNDNVVNLITNLTVRSTASYLTYFEANDVRCVYADFSSGTDGNTSISKTKLDTLNINTDNFFLSTSSSYTPTIIVHEASSGSKIFKLKDTINNEIANLSGNIPAFKILEGAYSVYDKGLVPSGTPSNGDTLVYNSTSGEWESQAVTGTSASGSLVMQVADTKGITSTSANTEYEVLAAGGDYNPNSLIVNTNQFEAPSAGVYVINVSCQFSSNASTGSSIYIYKNSTLFKFINKSEPKFLTTGDQVLTLASGDLINITISTSDPASYSILTNYTIKKIL